MKKLLFIPLALLLSGAQEDCDPRQPEGRPEDTRSTTAKKYDTTFMFEYEGCKLYRFYDGHYIYWANCKGQSETAWQQDCGEDCVRPTNVRSR